MSTAETDFESLSLNGWQRLWVVAVVAMGLLSAVVLVTNWPREEELLEEHAVYAVELGLRVVANKAKTVGNERDELTALRAIETGPSAVRREAYGDLSATELLKKIENVLKGTSELQALEVRQARDFAALARARWTYLGAAVAFWLGSAAVLYAVGWSVAWVRRGFQR